MYLPYLHKFSKTIIFTGTEATFSLLNEHAHLFQTMLEDLENNVATIKFKNYGLIATTLEDVFMSYVLNNIQFAKKFPKLELTLSYTQLVTLIFICYIAWEQTWHFLIRPLKMKKRFHLKPTLWINVSYHTYFA